MSIRSALASHLANSKSHYDLIEDRLYPVKRQQGSDLPAITYARMSAGRDVYLDGAASTAAPLFLIQHWAASYATADKLAECTRILLDGRNTRIKDGTTELDVAFELVEESDHYDAPIAADDAGGGAFHIDHVYRTQHRESRPSYI